MLVLADEPLAGRLQFAARCVLSRDLTAAELATLEAFYRKVTQPSADAPLGEPAAYTALAGVLFNLDAALTR